MKNIGVFVSEYFHFLEVKFSIYLNRSVFVMLWYESESVHFARVRRQLFASLGPYNHGDVKKKDYHLRTQPS